MFGCPRAVPAVPTRLVRLQPTKEVFFSVCSGINLLAKIAIAGAFANELYELSNAPFRQEQRDAVWGKNRSLSVGDIVEVDFVDGEKWMAVCKSVGWAFVKFDQRLIDILEACPTMFDREEIVNDIETQSELS